MSFFPGNFYNPLPYLHTFVLYSFEVFVAVLIIIVLVLLLLFMCCCGRRRFCRCDLAFRCNHCQTFFDEFILVFVSDCADRDNYTRRNAIVREKAGMIVALEMRCLERKTPHPSRPTGTVLGIELSCRDGKALR